MNNIKNNITYKMMNFVTHLTESIAEIGKTFVKRNNITNKNNKLDFKNTLYSCALALHCKGIEQVSSDLEVDNIISVTKNAIIKTRNNEKTYQHIKNLNDDLISKIYDPINNFLDPYNFVLTKNKTAFLESTNKIDKSLFINNTNKRFVACDGLQLNLNKELINCDDIKSSNSEQYGVALISSTYDVLNKIPINYNVTKSNENNFNKKKVNETTGFLDQLHLFNSNDVLIFDRWYYDTKLHKTMIDKNIGYMFRMKDNSTHFKNMKNGQSQIVVINGTNVQLFKYSMKNHNYNILTSITEKVSISEIKALYWKRWQIETDNKKFKYDILTTNIRSKNYNSFLADIECIRFVSIISSIIEYLGKGNLKFKKKFNTQNCIHILYKSLLRLLLYSTDGEEICRILDIVYKKIIDIVINRSFERIRISPSTKWNSYGNRYG